MTVAFPYISYGLLVAGVTILTLFAWARLWPEKETDPPIQVEASTKEDVTEDEALFIFIGYVPEDEENS